MSRADGPGLLDRLLGRRGRAASDLDPDRDDLRVVASGFEDAEASSTALERALSTEPRWSPQGQVVLRHHLLLPAGEVDDAVAVAGQDDYVATEGGPGLAGPDAAHAAEALATVPDSRVVVLRRVQVLDALHCSQERSRMAGLAQRRGGLVLGWDALQPPA